MTITVPPEACSGIDFIVEIMDVCAAVSADFGNLSVVARNSDIVLASFVLDEGQTSITVPLAGGFGILTASFNFDTGKLRLQGELCAVPFVICEDHFDEVIQFK